MATFLGACRGTVEAPPVDPGGEEALELRATCDTSEFDLRADTRSSLRLALFNGSRRTMELGQGELVIEVDAPWLSFPLHYFGRGPDGDAEPLSSRIPSHMDPGQELVLFDRPLRTLLLEDGWDWNARSRPPDSPLDGAQELPPGTARLELTATLMLAGSTLRSRTALVVPPPWVYSHVIWDTDGGGDLHFEVRPSGDDFEIHLRGNDGPGPHGRVIRTDGLIHVCLIALFAGRFEPDDLTFRPQGMLGTWTKLTLVSLEGKETTIRDIEPGGILAELARKARDLAEEMRAESNEEVDELDPLGERVSAEEQERLQGFLREPFPGEGRQWVFRRPESPEDYPGVTIGVLSNDRGTHDVVREIEGLLSPVPPRIVARDLECTSELAADGTLMRLRCWRDHPGDGERIEMRVTRDGGGEYEAVLLLGPGTAEVSRVLGTELGLVHWRPR